MKRFFSMALLALWLVPAAASAQGSIPERRFGVQWREGVPSVHFSAVDLADESLRERLESGIWERLVMRIYAYRANGDPIAVSVRSCRIQWDVWPQEYVVQYRSSDADRDETHASLDAVLSRCLVADRVAVGQARDYASLHGERIYFAALIELNPLTPAQIHRLRRWLSQPAGGGRIGGEAFFGSFVSLFVNRRIGSAERTLRFRSQRVAVP
ncbi:MAG: hypothetical protein H6719_22870 [Sandaracinaceae bacterium]|nr:hypothetical protein [Sandaracinaceae bacterium]